MTATRVELSGEATFAADGTAVITTRPVPLAQRWRLTRLSVFTTSTTPTAAYVYMNSAQAPNLLDSTAGGNSDTTDTPMDLLTADRLVIEWTGGDPGTTARFTATGEAI